MNGPQGDNLADVQSLAPRNAEAVAANMIRQLLMDATGSEPHSSDRREIIRILAQTKSSSHGLRSLNDAIVQSELFLTR